CRKRKRNRRQLHITSKSSRRRRACRECRVYSAEGCARAGDWPCNGRALLERSAPARISRDAIQFCRIDQRIGGQTLAKSRNENRRHLAGRVSAFPKRVCRLLRHVSVVRKRLTNFNLKIQKLSRFAYRERAMQTVIQVIATGRGSLRSHIA